MCTTKVQPRTSSSGLFPAALIAFSSCSSFVCVAAAAVWCVETAIQVLHAYHKFRTTTTRSSHTVLTCMMACACAHFKLHARLQIMSSAHDAHRCILCIHRCILYDNDNSRSLASTPLHTTHVHKGQSEAELYSHSFLVRLQANPSKRHKLVYPHSCTMAKYRHLPS